MNVTPIVGPESLGIEAMYSRLAIACCFALPAIVVHTCVRIEVLNARCGTFLPRTIPPTENPKWRVAANKTLLKELERMIASERLNAFKGEHPDEFERPIAEFRGPPFTDAEQALIETRVRRNTLNAALRDWVSGMGLLQYILAPITLLLSLVLLFRTAARSVRMALVACTVSNGAAMCLMVYRGYFTSLGW